MTGCAYDIGGFKISRDEFEKKVVKSSEVVEVIIISQEDKEKVDRKCREGNYNLVNANKEKINVRPSELMAACAIWTPKNLPDKQCFLVFPQNTPVTFLGHEIRHCFEGAFHL